MGGGAWPQPGQCVDGQGVESRVGAPHKASSERQVQCSSIYSAVSVVKLILGLTLLFCSVRRTLVSAVPRVHLNNTRCTAPCVPLRCGHRRVTWPFHPCFAWLPSAHPKPQMPSGHWYSPSPHCGTSFWLLCTSPLTPAVVHVCVYCVLQDLMSITTEELTTSFAPAIQFGVDALLVCSLPPPPCLLREGTFHHL